MLATEDFINSSLTERHDKEIPVWTGPDISDDAEITADEQAFTLGDLVFGEVICHTILQARVVHRDLSAIAGQVEME